MNQPTAPDSNESKVNAGLSYQGSRVPWYVFALWVAFFLVFGVYMFVNALPSIRRLMAESKFDTFPF
jgi:hypothetical protein